MPDIVVTVAAAWATLLLVGGGLLLLRARDALQRMLALDVLVGIVIVLLTILSYVDGVSYYIDAALALALLSFTERSSPPDTCCVVGGSDGRRCGGPEWFGRQLAAAAGTDSRDDRAVRPAAQARHLHQLHPAGLITGPAVLLVLLASIGSGRPEIITSAVLVIGFVLVTSSLSSHAIAQAALHRARNRTTTQAEPDSE